MKWIKRIGQMILSEEIRESNKKFDYLVNWNRKLEDAIVDEDKETMIQAMYNVAERRNKEVKFEFGDRKELTKTPLYSSWTVPIHVMLVDKNS